MTTAQKAAMALDLLPQPEAEARERHSGTWAHARHSPSSDHLSPRQAPAPARDKNLPADG
jgi:hypothetical protein